MTDWQTRAACAKPDVDPSLFDARTEIDARKAAAICARCPVVFDCYEESRSGDNYGLWAGYVRYIGTGWRPVRPAVDHNVVLPEPKPAPKPVPPVVLHVKRRKRLLAAVLAERFGDPETLLVEAVVPDAPTAEAVVA